jgi:hypothetical protein
MRLVFLIVFCVANLYGQGGGGVQFRDLTAHFATQRPTLGCTNSPLSRRA